MKRNRQDSRQTVQAPLVVLAGFPHPICGRVAKSIEARSSVKARVVFEASGNDGRRLYREGTVTALIRGVSNYVARQVRTQTAPQRPKHMLLVYVPADDEERLLSEFEFFVFPVRLSRLAAYNTYGRQNRHDLYLATRYVVSSLETTSTWFMEVKRRLSSISDREPLFLPPRNFRVSKTERMSDMFSAMQRQRASWVDPVDRVQTVRVTSDDLNKSIPLGANKEVLSDFRGLLFPHDPSYHGPQRELAKDCSHEERKHFLRSRFRFGVPLTDGFHHDVQFAGRTLQGTQFECSQQGSLELNCSHANIYPNDYVRPAQK